LSGGSGQGRGQRVAARAAVAPHDVQLAAVVQAVEQFGAQPAVAAEPVLHRALAEPRVDVGRVRLAEFSHHLKHLLRELPARLVPHAPRGPRVHQRAQLGRDEAVVDEEILLQRQRGIAPLQVAGAVIADALAQRQVLGARRRAQRVGLHEATEPLHGVHQRGRGEQAARHGVAAQLGNRQRHARSVPRAVQRPSSCSAVSSFIS
jgi:hypothetical protein